MFPFISFGSLQISTFSLMICVGVVAFILCILHIVEKKENTDRKTTNRILLVSFVGLALMYLFAFFFNSLFHSIEKGKWVWGGITWLGGVIGAFPLTVWLLHKYCPRIKGNALFYFNLLIPAIVLGHAFGRVGCFLGGCCYGKETTSFLGVQFPHLDHAVYPTQLFEAVFELVLFAVMLVFYKRLKGHFLETYCFSYGVFRFLLEFMRGDNRGATGFFLSPSQVMSILLIVAGVLLLLYHKGVIFKKLSKKMQAYRKESERYGIYMREDIANAVYALKGLYKDGVLTQEEYESYKKDLESRI